MNALLDLFWPSLTNQLCSAITNRFAGLKDDGFTAVHSCVEFIWGAFLAPCRVNVVRTPQGVHPSHTGNTIAPTGCTTVHIIDRCCTVIDLKRNKLATIISAKTLFLHVHSSHMCYLWNFRLLYMNGTIWKNLQPIIYDNGLYYLLRMKKFADINQHINDPEKDDRLSQW